MTDNTDDYNFEQAGSSNLKSLFHNPSSPQTSSLIYTAPKQPKSNIKVEVKSEPEKTDLSTVCVQVVQVWKLTDGKYTPAGKHGIAIIGSSAKEFYELILYKEKRNIIMRAKICPCFHFVTEKDGFASFYDASNDNWLIKFNNYTEFALTMDNIKKYGGTVVAKMDNITKEEKSTETKTVHDSTTDADNIAKAEILSRIAKMGQSILSNKTFGFEPEVVTIPETSKASAASSDVGPLYSYSSRRHSPSTMTQTSSASQNVLSTSIVPNPYDLTVFIAENRLQNNDLKISISELSEKINCIMKFIETNKASSVPPSSNALDRKIKVFELRIENLLKELTSVQNENKTLKEKILEQDGMLNSEQQMQPEMHEQEAEKVELLVKEISILNVNRAQLSKVIEVQETQIQELQETLKSHQDNEGEIVRLSSTVSNLEKRLRNSEERHQQNNSTGILGQEAKEKCANFTTKLKEEMNEMYSNIVANIHKDYDDHSEICAVIAQNIKSVTPKIVKIFQQIYENQQESE